MRFFKRKFITVDVFSERYYELLCSIYLLQNCSLMFSGSVKSSISELRIHQEFTNFCYLSQSQEFIKSSLISVSDSAWTCCVGLPWLCCQHISQKATDQCRNVLYPLLKLLTSKLLLFGWFLHRWQDVSAKISLTWMNTRMIKHLLRTVGGYIPEYSGRCTLWYTIKHSGHDWKFYRDQQLTKTCHETTVQKILPDTVRIEHCNIKEIRFYNFNLALKIA